jgi:hypothetical protein
MEMVIGAEMNETPGTIPGDAGASDEHPTPNLSPFDFTPEDLRLNRGGYLSQRQRGRLQSTAGGIVKVSRSGAVVALVFVLFGVCMILAMYLQNESTRAALFSSPLNLLMLAGAMLLVLVIVVLAVYWTRRQTSALAQARLQTAQGPVRLEESFSAETGITGYYVFVGNQRFAFAEDMSGIFQQGKSYRVYYVHSGPYQIIMSLEETRS